MEVHLRAIRSVTCYMGSHSVTFHPAQVNTCCSALYQSQKIRRDHSASGGQQTNRTVTVTMIAIVLMYAILVAPGEILTCITDYLLSRYEYISTMYYDRQ